MPQNVTSDQLRRTLNFDGIELKLLFAIGVCNYGASIKYIGSNEIRGNIYHLVRNIIDVDEVNRSSNIENPDIFEYSHSMLLAQLIGSVISRAAYGCIVGIDEAVVRDYRKRDSDNNSDPATEEPIDPVDSFSLNPTALSV